MMDKVNDHVANELETNLIEMVLQCQILLSK